MPHSDPENAMYISLLFLAMSAADRKILRDELFISEKCALDYGIDSSEWERTLNLSFIKYFNEGDKVVEKAIDHLKRSLDTEKRSELVEDLLVIALIDDNYHQKESELLQRISRDFDVPCPDADIDG